MLRGLWKSRHDKIKYGSWTDWYDNLCFCCGRSPCCLAWLGYNDFDTAMGSVD